MRLLFPFVLFASLLVAAITVAQTQKASGIADFISVDTPVFVLDHVRVIDGTGTPAKEDQAVVIANGKIQFIGPDVSVQIPQGAQRMDRSGYTVIPGLVGMHNHLYYTDSYAVQVVDGKVGEPGLFIAEIPYTAPRLYLAAGVTTMRTTGSLEPSSSANTGRLLNIREQGHKAEVNVQLLVAVKQGEAGIVGNEVDLGFLVSAHHHDILEHS